jgi:aminoglycoside phosphotransferase (APT) family kinase protein
MFGVAMLDPMENKTAYQSYFSEALGAPVEILRVEPLEESSREAPWRFDLQVSRAEKSFVLRLDERSSASEYHIMKAVEKLPIPSPRVYGLDESGDLFGVPCFFMDYITGESLLKPMLAGESWAEELYIECAIRLQTIPDELLGEVRELVEIESAEDVLDAAYQKLINLNDPLAQAAYDRLNASIPLLPEVCFSNGDLYPDNFRINDNQLVAVIDFANATFSDPLFEFLLPFFCHPELRGRGMEERYCEVRGIDPAVLPWYHALEFYDLWGWLAGTEETFVGYGAKQLRQILAEWMESGELPD